MRFEAGLSVVICAGIATAWVLPRGLLSHMNTFHAACFVAARVLLQQEFVWQAVPAISFVLAWIDAMSMFYVLDAASDHFRSKTDPGQNPFWLHQYLRLLELGSCILYLLANLPDRWWYLVEIAAVVTCIVVCEPAVRIMVFFATGNRAVQHPVDANAVNDNVRPVHDARPLVALILGHAARPRIRHYRVQRLAR